MKLLGPKASVSDTNRCSDGSNGLNLAAAMLTHPAFKFVSDPLAMPPPAPTPEVHPSWGGRIRRHIHRRKDADLFDASLRANRAAAIEPSLRELKHLFALPAGNPFAGANLAILRCGPPPELKHLPPVAGGPPPPPSFAVGPPPKGGGGGPRLRRRHTAYGVGGSDPQRNRASGG